MMIALAGHTFNSLDVVRGDDYEPGHGYALTPIVAGQLIAESEARPGYYSPTDDLTAPMALHSGANGQPLMFAVAGSVKCGERTWIVGKGWQA